MAIRAIEHLFTGATSTTYNSAKTVLGNLIHQYTGSTLADKYAGPYSVAVARPFEQAGFGGIYPHVINWSSTKDWIFLADTATAAATRRIILYEFDKEDLSFEYKGFITMTYPTTTVHTVRAMRVARHLYTTGTVTVSGTSVTGSGTAWQSARYAVGGRIGFGSTDPTKIVSWYYISAISSNTEITLLGSAPAQSAGTAFVIEELRIYTANSNATVANGGLYVAKGINHDDFSIGGTVIPAAATTDNVKAIYWLADAATVLNTAACGIGLHPDISDTSHYLYVTNADAAATLRIYKYDVRAALGSLASGKSTSAFVLKTGAQVTVGNISTGNSARMVNCQHGPGANILSLYFATATRIVRVDETNIVENSTSFISDMMVEIPPGSVNTFAATGGLTSVEYAGTVDRFVITTGAAQRNYFTRYNASGAQMDHVMFSDNKQIDQSAADSGISPLPSTQGAGFSVWVENGIGYFVRNGTTAVLNQLYAVPIGVQWDYAGVSGNRLVTPSISTPNVSKFYRLYVNSERVMGSDNLGITPEPFRVFYRTSGISDNTGEWQSVPDYGDMSGVNPGTEIQFMFEFRICGMTAVPARIFGLSVLYEDTTTDSHYQPSVAQSSTVNKRFAWRFSTAFGGTVPPLRVRLYDAVTGSGPLVDDNTESPSGTWEKSIDDGVTWSAYDTNDKSGNTTYIRYTPSSLADNVKVRALLTQN